MICTKRERSKRRSPRCTLAWKPRMMTSTRLRMANLNHPHPQPSERQKLRHLAGTKGCPDRQRSLLEPYTRAVFSILTNLRSVREYMWPGGEAIASISDRATGNRWPPPFSTVTCSGNSDFPRQLCVEKRLRRQGDTLFLLDLWRTRIRRVLLPWKSPIGTWFDVGGYSDRSRVRN